MQIKLKSYIVGHNIMTDKVEIFNNETDASRDCQVWTVVEAESRKLAKEEYIEKYRPVIEE